MRSRVNRVFEILCPRLLVHGHHHVWETRTVQLHGSAHSTQVVSLAADGASGTSGASTSTTSHAQPGEPRGPLHQSFDSELSVASCRMTLGATHD
jgi:hypothetical protein